MSQDERYDAYADLGGRTPESISIESKIAIVQSGLGSNAMRLEVERYLDKQENAEQRKINKAGADLVRRAGVPKPEEPQGIDTQAIMDGWDEYARKHQEDSGVNQTDQEN